MNRREANDLDRYITGNWGEDSVGDEPEDAPDPRIAAADAMAKALKKIRFICTAEGHAPCRCGGMAYGEVCANTCVCEWPDDIKPIVDAALAAYNATRPLTGQEESDV